MPATRTRPLALRDFDGPHDLYLAASIRYGHSNDSWEERSRYDTARDLAWSLASVQAAVLLATAFGVKLEGL